MRDAHLQPRGCTVAEGATRPPCQPSVLMAAPGTPQRLRPRRMLVVLSSITSVQRWWPPAPMASDVGYLEGHGANGSATSPCWGRESRRKTPKKPPDLVHTKNKSRQRVLRVGIATGPARSC